MLPEAMTTIGEGIRRIQCSTHKTEIRALERPLLAKEVCKYVNTLHTASGFTIDTN